MLSSNVSIRAIISLLAFMIVLGLLVLSKRLHSRHNAGDRLFFGMGINVLVYAGLAFATVAIPFKTPETFFFFKLLADSFIEITVLFLLYQWILFVGFTIYGSADYLRRRYWPFFIPIPVLIICLFVNWFTGFMFEYSHLLLKYHTVYYIVPVLELVYILITAVMIIRHNLKADRRRRFHLTFVLIPVAIGFLTEYVVSINLGPLSFAAALIFIFFSMTERWQYYDEERGFYNSAFFDYMKELVAEGRKDYTSVIYIKCKNMESEMAAIIKKELPHRVVKVHVRNDVYGIYAENGSEDLMDMIADVIREGVSDYEKESGKTLEFDRETLYRKSGESAAEFLRRIEVK